MKHSLKIVIEMFLTCQSFVTDGVVAHKICRVKNFLDFCDVFNSSNVTGHTADSAILFFKDTHSFLYTLSFIVIHHLPDL